jgi:hypothetical protein
VEFVGGWAITRIILGVSLLFIAVIATVLLWTFLGVPENPFGFRGLGARVLVGLVLGGLVLLCGLVVMLGWICLSWLVV